MKNLDKLIRSITSILKYEQSLDKKKSSSEIIDIIYSENVEELKNIPKDNSYELVQCIDKYIRLKKEFNMENFSYRNYINQEDTTIKIHDLKLCLHYQEICNTYFYLKLSFV